MHLRSVAALIAALATAAGVAAPVASATTPTSPPPLTVLSQTGSLGDRDIFITPSGDSSTTMRAGPRSSARAARSSGSIRLRRARPRDFRTQTYDGHQC